MEIFVTQANQLSKATSRHRATHILTLLDPGQRPFLHPHFDKKNWLHVVCEDVLSEDERHAPTIQQVQQILEWGANLQEDAVVVVACFAGVSRSTASALSLLVQHHGIDKIDVCIEHLLKIRPQACPNSLIIKFADGLLGCGGELFEKSEKVANAKILKLLS